MFSAPARKGKRSFNFVIDDRMWRCDFYFRSTLLPHFRDGGKFKRGWLCNQ